MAQRLGWGILGTGNIARQFAAGIRASRTGSLVAVGSRAISTAYEFARSFAVPHATGGYAQVLRTPGVDSISLAVPHPLGSYADVLRAPGVDAIYNALPNSMHHPWTIAALKAGKHVLCEKPLASSADEAREMFDVAQSSGRVLVEAFMYRSHPQTLAALESVKSGSIGQLKLVRTSFCFRTSRIDGNIRFSRELAGGALMDIGCYCINFSRLFAQEEPAQITVSGKLHESGIDELATGTMSFPGGIVAGFTCGMTLQADNTAFLCGSEGFLAIPVPWKPPSKGAGFVIARSTPPRMDAAGKAQPAPPPPERVVVDCEGDLYGNEADDFAATVAGQRPPRITREDSLGNMKVLDIMREQLGVTQ